MTVSGGAYYESERRRRKKKDLGELDADADDLLQKLELYEGYDVLEDGEKTFVKSGSKKGSKVVYGSSRSNDSGNQAKEKAKGGSASLSNQLNEGQKASATKR